MTDEELHGHLRDQQGSRASLNTPALVVDLDALDRNIERMAAFATANGVQLRPHAKTHKSPDIARRQLAEGAIGICCAKIGEAEALADNGVTQGLHITSPVVSPMAIGRLVALNERTERTMCVVDDCANVAALGAAAAESAKPLSVIIDIDPGMHRTGVASAATAVDVLQAIRAEPALRYEGVQFTAVRTSIIGSFDERRAAMETSAV